jgi:integrase
MEVQADRRDLPISHDPKALERMTLAVLVERYRDTISVRKRGGAAERYWLNAFLRHPICRQPLSTVCTSDFAAYRDERLKTIKPSTLKRQLAPIHNLFEVARAEWGLPLKENPLANLSLKTPHGDKRERRLKPGEWDRLAQAARLSKNPNVFPIIAIAIETGMRRGEILGMLWDHLDRANGCLFIPHTKNGHSRTIPLTKAAWEILDVVPKSETTVFPTNANAFRLAWVRVLKRAEIKDLRFHDLRHEAISRFFEKGLSVPEVALVSGHRDARMLFRYAHPLRQRIIAVLEGEATASAYTNSPTGNS